ncbi:MAG: VOC family protein [Planctomycetota bacterium]
MSFNENLKTGYFCWADLGADDYDGTVAFYSALFDWSVENRGEGGHRYGIARLDGHDVGAIYQKIPGAMPEGLAPVWTLYARVADVEAAVGNVERLGGSVLVAATDVPDHGRLALVADPEGAHFGLWEPRGHDGFELVDEPGTPTWFELAGRDIEGTSRFYAELFGWDWVTHASGDARYTVFERDDDIPIAGMMEMTSEWGDMPPHWMLYFEVFDTDEAAERVKELGGQVCVPPSDLPYGRFAVVNDPGGGTFSLIVPRGVAD